MELLTWIVVGVLGVFGSIFLHILAFDIHEHAPALATRLVRLAVGLLPATQRERYQEEWLAHLVEVPGVLAKFAHALGCLRAAHGVAKAMRPNNWAAFSNELKWWLRREFALSMVAKAARGDFAGATSTWSMINSTVEIIRKHLLVMTANNFTDELALRAVHKAVTRAAEELHRKYEAGPAGG
jgi:hypothetical protein